jgi:Brp/Blh family beta-carotene 15,15'-monooxygenase
MYFQYALVFILVGVIGMAHGSIDHIIASDVLKIVPSNRKRVFIFFYLLIIGLYLVLWFISPLISFILFILYSAFHFGQADVEIIGNKLSKTARILLGSSYGILLLSSMLYFTHNYTLDHSPDWFLEILPPDVINTVSMYSYYIFLVLTIVQMAFHAWKRKVSLSEISLFIVQLTFVLLLFKVLPPLVAFSLYFGLWHSLFVLKKEFQEVRKIGLIINLKAFIKALFPFTFVSLAGLMVITYFGAATAHFTTLVAISVLAFPHTVLMHLLYSRQN